ncbi:MAG: hypothetical protein RLZZ507_804 [Cyanobacteriota bacterium]|jgi:hypothetical protein
MNSKQVSPLIFSISILLMNLPAYANPMGLNSSDLAFCSSVRDARVREAIANSQRSSQTNVNIGIDVKFPIKGIPIGIGGNSNGSGSSSSSSSSNREMAMSQYQSTNCDQLLKSAAEVTIAEINADAAKAIARMQMESFKYGADIQRDIANINAGAMVEVANINAQASTKVASIQTNGSVNQTLIQAGAGLLSTIIAPPSRPAEINADVEKARIAADLEKAKIAAEIERQRIAAANADPGLTLLQNWGLTATGCNNVGIVSITIDNRQYCAFATNWLSVGQYVYNRSTNNLEPLAINRMYTSPPVENNYPEQTNPTPSSGGGFE